MQCIVMLGNDINTFAFDQMQIQIISVGAQCRPSFTSASRAKTYVHLEYGSASLALENLLLKS